METPTCYGCLARTDSALHEGFRSAKPEMFIPLHDANSLKRIKLQYVTIGLIAANVIVYFFTTLGSEQFATAAVYAFGYIPSVVFDYADLPHVLEVSPPRTSAASS